MKKEETTKKQGIQESEITDQFPPVCPICGESTIWQSDFMTSECGYTRDEDEENDRIVHVFACTHCDCVAEYEDLEDDGKMALLSTTVLGDEDDERDCVTKYSKYAQDKYGLENYGEEEENK